MDTTSVLRQLGKMIKSNETSLHARDLLHVSSPLIPWSPGETLTQEQKVQLLDKPAVYGSKKVRPCKDEIYRQWAMKIAEVDGIRGPMITLGAAYAPEILTIMKSFVGEEEFVTCEKENESAHLLHEYYSRLNAFRPQITLMKEDIFEVLNHWFDGKENAKPIALFDFDLMSNLSPKMVAKISMALNKCAAKRFTAAIWTPFGRKCWTEEQYDLVVRPSFLHEVVMSRESAFNLIEYHPYKYIDNHFPMKVEMLFLERK